MNDRKEQALRYFRGTITASEEQDLHDWVSADPANLETLHLWEDEWKKSEASGSSQGWEAILARVAVRQTVEDGDLRLHKNNRSNLYYALGAVAAAIVIALVFVPFHRQPQPSLNYITEAPIGEKCRVILPDSTAVWLKSGSRLSYASDFGRGSRTVSLTGEGFFDVTRNESSPFIVNCSNARVEVKGTKFNLTAYPEDHDIITSVLEGHVVFSSGDAGIELLKGQSAHFDVLKRSFARSSEDPSDLCAWTESRMVFDNSTLSELAERLSRTYGVRFHFNAPECLGYTFNISLRNNETLPDILSAIEKTTPVRIKTENDNVYIDRK